ncbi:MAG: hypothetical protein RIS29_2909 [Bacteroidota bacterium]|jgi:hypothetical protein
MGGGTTMGISIHYSGRLAQPDQLENLIEEVEDIAKVHQWKYHIYERNFPPATPSNHHHDGNLYGIDFSPPQCEPVSFSFLSTTQLCGIFSFLAWKDAANDPEQSNLYITSTKTQYTGIEIHQLIIGIFRYISKKYLSDFIMNDESQYWETNDKKLLTENFIRNGALIDSFSSLINNSTRFENEDIEQYLLRLIEILNKNKPK